MEYQEKVQRLKTLLAELLSQGLCVAFSGGVDSAVLLYLAEVLRREHHLPAGSLRAVLFATRLHPPADEADARRQAEEMGVPLTVLAIDEFSDPAILQNPPDRCYRCKTLLFRRLRELADSSGAAAADGTNFDDLFEYRPGLRALQELGIRSPLAEVQLTKAEVRRLAAEFGLRVSQKPSSPCMATRLPYGDRLTPEKLRQAAEGEALLKELRFPVNRVRIHGNLARIEIPKTEFARFLEQSEMITERIKKSGVLYVTLDVQGFRSGSMDEALKIEKAHSNDNSKEEPA